MNDKASLARLAILAPLKQWGGIERNLLILCREFVDRGIAVDYLLTRGGQVPYPEQFPAAVNIVDLNTRGKADALPRMARYLRQCRPDAVMTVKDHAAKVAVLARLFAGSRSRVYVTVNNTLSQTLRRRLKRWTAMALYPRADGVIAVSEGVRADAIDNLHFPPARVTTIHNPVVTPDMAERAAAPLTHPWLSEAGPPVFLGVGRLHHQKDFPNLIRAFSIVRAHRPCRLVILGEGPEREALEALARDLAVADDVDLPGYVSDPLPWMARAAAFVLSSRYEGLGNVLVEAMAVGAPVASTDCPSGPSEILDGGRHGPLVPVNDPDALATAMESLLEAPGAREQRIEAAQRFRSDRVAAAYIAAMGLGADV